MDVPETRYALSGDLSLVRFVREIDVPRGCDPHRGVHRYRGPAGRRRVARRTRPARRAGPGRPCSVRRPGGEDTGDGFLAVFDGPARAVRCASELAGAVRPLGIEVRADVHTGECEVTGNDVAGLAVHVGARVAALAGPGEVLVSSTVKDLVLGSGLEFQPRGATTLKGVPGEWQLFALAAEALVSVPHERLRTTDRMLVGVARRAPRLSRWVAERTSRTPSA